MECGHSVRKRFIKKITFFVLTISFLAVRASQLIREAPSPRSFSFVENYANKGFHRQRVVI